MKIRNRTDYTPEQRQLAISLVLEKKLSCSQVGREMNIPPSCVSRWVRFAQGADQGLRGPNEGPALTPEQQRIRMLEAQVRELEKDNDLLKKASAFFARNLK